MVSSDKKPHPKKSAFLEAYSKVATISHAAKLANIDRTTHYQWLKDDAQYASDFHDAKLAACDNLEAEARRRAMVGCEDIVYYQGVECGRVRKYSDVLLIVLLKANMPQKYIERRAIEHSTTEGGLKIAEKIITNRMTPVIEEQGNGNGNGGNGTAPSAG